VREDKRHTLRYTAGVKPFRWGPEKNAELLAERGIAFEQVVVRGIPKTESNRFGTRVC
jgi:hypothetical protein